MNFLDDYSEYELEQRYYIIWYLDIYRTYEKEVTVEEFVKAIENLSNGIKEGKKFQTLLRVTGSGKTFKMANIIEKVQKPTLVLAHNKTLARPTIF